MPTQTAISTLKPCSSPLTPDPGFPESFLGRNVRQIKKKKKRKRNSKLLVCHHGMHTAVCVSLQYCRASRASRHRAKGIQSSLCLILLALDAAGQRSTAQGG